MNRSRHFCSQLLLLATLSFCAAAQEPSQTGRLSAKLTERSPVSSIREVCRRLGWPYEQIERQAKQQSQELDYDVSKESVEIYVPSGYDGSEPYGLICWVSAGGGGRVIDRYTDVLDRHKLIWVSPNNNGNNRVVWCRVGVALDATHHAVKRFKIDPERVYISGGSGGGRTSSMMGVCFPDVYHGGIYVIGMNFYRTLSATNEPGKMWSKTYSPPPDAKLFRLAKERSVHIALEGDDDINRHQAKAIIEAYKKDGYRHALYLEQPGLGHSTPSEEWFEKAVVALAEMKEPSTAASIKPAAAAPAPASSASAADELKAARELALKDPAAGYQALQAFINRHPKSPQATEALTIADALLAANPALRKTIDAGAEADKLLRVAQIYVQNRMYPQARQRLQTIISTYPGSPAAAEAKKLLAEIGKN